MLERLSFGTFVIRFNSFCVWGLPFMTSLNRKFTQPPFLRLLTMSAFDGTPTLGADVLNGSPLPTTIATQAND